jgi:hypothetical protein
MDACARRRTDCAASCAMRLVTCKPPICVRAACHQSARPKARVTQVQSGAPRNRSRQYQAVGLSGQSPSIASVIADTCAKEPVGAQLAKHGRMVVAKAVARNAEKPRRRRLFGQPPARLGPSAPARTPQEAIWTPPPLSRLWHLGLTDGGGGVCQHCDEEIRTTPLIRCATRSSSCIQRLTVRVEMTRQSAICSMV